MSKKKSILIGDIIGWLGAAILLVAYVLVSTNVIAAQTMTYQVLNLTGAAGLVVLGITRKAYPSAALNIIWAAIGIVVIFGILFK